MIFFLLIWSISVLGFFAFATSTSKLQQKVFQRLFSTQYNVLLKVLGFVFILISLSLSFRFIPLNDVAMYWIGSLVLAALTVGLSFYCYASKIKLIVIGFTWLMLMTCNGYFMS